MHSPQVRVAHLAADRRQEIAAVIEAAVPRLNAAAETLIAYAALSAFWGIVLYLLFMTIPR